MLNLHEIFFLSGSGPRCSAASTVCPAARDFRCSIHHLKQRSDYTTIGAARHRGIA
jgi:hypothetical protein